MYAVTSVQTNLREKYFITHTYTLISLYISDTGGCLTKKSHQHLIIHVYDYSPSD